MSLSVSGRLGHWFEVSEQSELIGRKGMSEVANAPSDDPKVPVHLLIHATQTAITTATCIADYLSWPGYTNAQKIELGKLYVPYLALCKSSYPLSSHEMHC